MKWLSRKAPILLFLFTASCIFVNVPTGDIINYRVVEVPAYHVSMKLPATWHIRSDSYYQLIASGFAPNHLAGRVEYRGIANEKLDANNYNLYAQGWYEAISKNYPDWKYTRQSNSVDGKQVIYRFEGTYRVANYVYRRIGKLIIRGTTVHAIYFSGEDIDFELTRPVFDEIERSIKFLNN